MIQLSEIKLAIIGLGYVGLPLAVEFGRKYQTIGYDINNARITELISGTDFTQEVSCSELKDAAQLKFSALVSDLAACNVYIVTVPTPIDSAKRPDLSPLINACEMIADVIKVGDVVVYESTVYPGCTEEICVPILERISGLKLNIDFFVGYSPERINPGDKEHRLTNIIKITSGSTPSAADFIDDLYRSIIVAGTHKVSSLKVAEAAKVIENTQRDVNIALVNELSLIFNKLGIDTIEVLEAAGTKWNFLPFRPGLVGGHCIGVDPYYLTHKAQEVGYHPEVILAGRRINDGMGAFVANQTIRLMAAKKINPVAAKILVLGIAFKENCPDVRNSRVVDILASLNEYHTKIDIYDPWVDAAQVEHEYGVQSIKFPEIDNYDAIIIAVAHHQFKALGAAGIRAFGKKSCVIYDVKNIFPHDSVDGRL
jgi:UDP-N-acetyl-D-galactosamine dehydrogenase